MERWDGCTYIECDYGTSECLAYRDIVSRIDQQIKVDDQVQFLVCGHILDFDRFQTGTLIFADFSCQNVLEVLRKSTTQLTWHFLECFAFNQQRRRDFTEDTSSTFICRESILSWPRLEHCSKEWILRLKISSDTYTKNASRSSFSLFFFR